MTVSLSDFLNLCKVVVSTFYPTVGWLVPRRGSPLAGAAVPAVFRIPDSGFVDRASRRFGFSVSPILSLPIAERFGIAGIAGT